MININLSTLKSSVLAFVSIGLFSLAAHSQESEPFELGVDYQIVEKKTQQEAAQLSELESISAIEIFYWFGCEACFQVEAAIFDYLQQNPDLRLRRTPLVIRAEWRQQAYLQGLMEQYQGVETLPSVLDIYRQCLDDCQVFQQFESSARWFADQVDSESSRVIDQQKIWQQEKNYRKRADLYSISQVPSIIINETYKVDANQAKTAKRLIEIIDYLLAKE